ncbi:peptidase S8/S53 domain-containing protein [Pseudomassariella vexata]|uniref:Peptidase S8/S53 domain-containing protein n=1 Tax=Pseudomassariella vexata TaxID=1141098 RepID=A0A1Y2DPY8_9PEZI|nr:peptidase S8/S53 domain-containing protein [Pseudomassariella vexata]ORY61361.1 peptidase S8/S53 domain-containing protein [Pseudomassariella vexata]
MAGNYIVKLKEGFSTAVTDHVYTIKGFKRLSLEAVQNHADVTPWGIARITHRAVGSITYVYDSSAGAETCAYVINTEIYTAHSRNDHDIHVSGTTGGTTSGVAKQTKLYTVKVPDAYGSGTNSGVIAGMYFVTTDWHTRSCPNGTVANTSLGGAASLAVNTAAAKMVGAGVFLAVATGNNNANACTIGATTSANARASYSSYGAVFDIFAPSSSILSSWIDSTAATNNISGTSMSPTSLSSYMQNIETSDASTGIPSGTVNLLALNSNPSGSAMEKLARSVFYKT